MTSKALSAEHDGPDGGSRFGTRPEQFLFGRMQDAALGVEPYLCASKDEVIRGLLEGVEGIRREFEANGTELDKLCMRYVLDGEAGSCGRVFSNGNLRMDCGPDGRVLPERQVMVAGDSLLLPRELQRSESGRTYGGWGWWAGRGAVVVRGVPRRSPCCLL